MGAEKSFLGPFCMSPKFTLLIFLNLQSTLLTLYMAQGVAPISLLPSKLVSNNSSMPRAGKALHREVAMVLRKKLSRRSAPTSTLKSATASHPPRASLRWPTPTKQAAFASTRTAVGTEPCGITQRPRVTRLLVVQAALMRLC